MTILTNILTNSKQRMMTKKMNKMIKNTLLFLTGTSSTLLASTESHMRPTQPSLDWKMNRVRMPRNVSSKFNSGLTHSPP